jgi:ribosome-associated translation inhibitor RaiA
MQIRVLSRTQQAGIDAEVTTRERARRLLDRFAARIGSIEVQLVDVNGPKGGVDRACEVRAELVDGTRLRTHARDSLIPRAIDAAIRRLVRVIAEHGKRRIAARRRDGRATLPM